MTNVITYQRFWQRRDTPANWAAVNPTLHDGEIGVALAPGESPTTVLRFKIGDGLTPWNSLPWCGTGALLDPGANRLLWWNNAAKAYEFLQSVPAVNGGTGQTGFATGDILYASSATALAKLAIGTDGKIIRAISGLPAWDDEGTPSGTTLLGTATVTGSAASSLTLSGLDLSLYRYWELVFQFENATGSNSNCSLNYNADATATNYNRQILTANNTTVTGARANDGVIVTLAANETVTGRMTIATDRDGKPRAWGLINRDAAATPIGAAAWHVWNSATNPTGITIPVSVANSLAVGSTFSVFGVA